jgi:hypothetical protein
MVRRRAAQKNKSNDMLAETVQQENHIFSLPTEPAITTEKVPPKIHQLSSCQKWPTLLLSLLQERFSNIGTHSTFEIQNQMDAINC